MGWLFGHERLETVGCDHNMQMLPCLWADRIGYNCNKMVDRREQHEEFAWLSVKCGRSSCSVPIQRRPHYTSIPPREGKLLGVNFVYFDVIV